ASRLGPRFEFDPRLMVDVDEQMVVDPFDTTCPADALLVVLIVVLKRTDLFVLVDRENNLESSLVRHLVERQFQLPTRASANDLDDGAAGGDDLAELR